MAAVAKNPSFAKKVGIKPSVGEEFLKADKGRTFKQGGIMATKRLFKGKETYAEEMKEAKALKSGRISPRQFEAGEKSEGHKEENSAKLAKAIKSGKMSPSAYAKMESKEPKGMKMGGVAKKVTKEMEYDYKTGKKSFAGTTAQRDRHAEKEGKIVAKHAAYDKSMGMKKGGKVCMARGGGVEIKGKTKGKFIKMKGC